MRNSVTRCLTVVILPLILLLSSCITNKKYVLLQNYEGFQSNPEILYASEKYRLHRGDVIQIDVKTMDKDNEVQAIFSGNQQQGGINQGGLGIGAGDIYYFTGYALDDSGYISLPIIGDINVLDKTLTEAQFMIQERLREYFTTALFVVVKFGGIRFSFLGEVSRPGKYVLPQNRVNLLEALALVGDFKEIARRDKVLLIRQYPEGYRIHELNFLDINLVNSPYYYLQPNDILYVEPLKVRSLGTGYTALQTFTAIITVVNSTFLILNLLK